MRNSICIAIFLITVLLSGCTANGGKHAGYDACTVYTPQYASHFVIDSLESGKIITTTNPWQGADSVSTSLFISTGAKSAPEGFDGKFLNAPARRIVATSSTHIALLDALDALDRLVAVSGKMFVNNPKVTGADSIADVGYDSNFDYETLLSKNPDLVLLYGINGSSVMEKHLDRLGIPYAYIGDYLEENPLGKAEWLVAMGEIIGNRAKAEEVFKPIPERYNSIKEKISALGGAKTAVMLNSPYGDSWFMPPSDSYMVQLISDAGGNYLYPVKSRSSVPIDIEEAYKLTSVCDVWLNPGMYNSIAALMHACPAFNNLKVVTEKEIYNNNLRTTPSGGNDFFEGAIVHPDEVLLDLAKIFHPELYPDREFVYYRRLQ